MKPPRDPDRIEPLLALLREVWGQCPDLRLAQLIVNLCPRGTTPCPHVFFTEDDVIECGLREMLTRRTPERETKAEDHGA